MISQKYKDLTITELKYIARWWKPNATKNKKGMREIARDLGRSPSTISAAIKNHKKWKTGINQPWKKKYYFDLEEALESRSKKNKNKGRKSKLNKGDSLFKTFKKMMIQNASIEVIYNRLEKQGNKPSVCVRTIYNYVKKYGKNLLIEGSYQNKAIYKAKRHKKSFKFKTIFERPPIKNQFGHWEIDRVVSKKGTRGAILVLTELMTNYNINKYIPKLNSVNINSALCEVFNEHDHSYFKTITSDNGLEFSRIIDFEKVVDCGIYFARPYCSTDKPYVERNNRMIRKMIPKGSNLENYDENDIKEVTQWMNNYERKSRDFKTPANMFKHYTQL